MRKEWPDVSEEHRQKIETKLQCCGFDDIKDGISGCTFKKTCEGFIPKEYSKRIHTGAAIGAAGLLGGALALFGSFCLQKKMAKQVSKQKQKNFTSLADEARGIDKTTKKRRPRNSGAGTGTGGSTRDVPKQYHDNAENA